MRSSGELWCYEIRTHKLRGNKSVILNFKLPPFSDVYFPLGNSPASESYIPTFRNIPVATRSKA